MKARRSESCPRPGRKPVSGATPPQAEPRVLPAALAPLLTRACTLQDLGPEDKQKVTKLLKQVVELGQEVQTLRQQRDETAKQFAEREEELKENHRQLHKEHLLLKKKLGQVLLVLRASQAKVHALEATQQAAEPAQKPQPSSDPFGESDAAVLPRDQQAQPCPQAPSGLGHDEGSSTACNGIGTPCSSSPAPVQAATAGPSAPALLHVAPGTRVSITIHHTSNPHAALQASGPDPGGVIAIPTTTAPVPAPAVHVQSAGACDAGPPNPDAPSCSSHSPTAPRTWRRGAGAGAAGAGEGGWGATSSYCAATAMSAGWPRASCVSVASSSGVGLGAAGTGAAGSRVRTGPRSIQVDSSMQHFEAVPVEEVSLESPTGQLGSPMIVPPSEEVVAAASSLLGWQAQQGFMSADEATSALRSGPRGANDAPACSAARASSSRYSLGCGNAATGAMARKVLSYDPAIGRNGAFYFVDVDSPPDSDVVPAGRSAVVPPVRDQNSAGSGVGHAPGQGGMCTPGSAAASGTQGGGEPARDAAASGGAGAQLTGQPYAAQRCAAAELASTRQLPSAQHAHGQALSLPARAMAAELPAAVEGSSGVEARLQPAHNHSATAVAAAAYQDCCPVPSSRAGAVPTEAAAAAAHARPGPSLHVVGLPRGMWHGHGQELQQPGLTVPQPAPPLSPCSYAASDSTAAVTPLAPLHAAALALAQAGVGSGQIVAGGCNSNTGAISALAAGGSGGGGDRGCVQTPVSTTGSLCRMAVMLDDLARRQHWAVQPPPGIAPAQPLMLPASPTPGLAQEHQQHQQPASGSTGGPQAVAAWLETHAGPASSVGGSCITERYDESFVDILSQVDDELEQQYLQQQRQQQKLQQQQDQAAKLARQRGQRGGRSTGAHAGGQRQHGSPATAAGMAVAGPTPRSHKVSMDALLAANIFEENDVLSAILEQER